MRSAAHSQRKRRAKAHNGSRSNGQRELVSAAEGSCGDRPLGQREMPEKERKRSLVFKPCHNCTTPMRCQTRCKAVADDRQDLLTLNATVRGMRRSPRGDPWQAFDALPKPIRDAMQEGVSPVCPLKVKRLFREERRRHGEAAAIARVVQRIEDAQRRKAMRASVSSSARST